MGKGLFLRSKNHTSWVTTFALGSKNSWLTYAADSSSALVCLAWEIGVRRSPLGYVALAGVSGYVGIARWSGARGPPHLSLRQLFASGTTPLRTLGTAVAFGTMAARDRTSSDGTGQCTNWR